MERISKIGKTKSSIYGVGINDVDSPTRWLNADGILEKCKFYQKWKGMLERCCSVEFKEKMPSYKNVSVCDEWKLFSNFKNWMVTQDYENKELDKDLLIEGNLVYSPETCCFIDHHLNTLLLENNHIGNELPLGVTFRKSRNKFIAQIKIKGVSKHLGSFSNPEEAILFTHAIPTTVPFDSLNSNKESSDKIQYDIPYRFKSQLRNQAVTDLAKTKLGWVMNNSDYLNITLSK